MDRDLKKQIDTYIDDMIKLGYDMTNIFLVFNGKKYQKEKFTYRGISVIYDDSIHTDFEFREYKARSYISREVRDRKFARGGVI